MVFKRNFSTGGAAVEIVDALDSTATDKALSANQGRALNVAKSDTTHNHDTAYADIAHVSETNNPHSVTAAQVGLSNVDNTADADKPISSAAQSALNNKADASHNHNLADLSEKNFSSLSNQPSIITDLTGITPASGDLIYYNGTNWVRLAKGSDGQNLGLDSGLPAWADAAGGGAWDGMLVFGADVTVTSSAMEVFYTSELLEAGNYTLLMNLVCKESNSNFTGALRIKSVDSVDADLSPSVSGVIHRGSANVYSDGILIATGTSDALLNDWPMTDVDQNSLNRMLITNVGFGSAWKLQFSMNTSSYTFTIVAGSYILYKKIV